jgi:DNA-binding LacI/PurR family transcriptional regulator
MVNGSTHVDGVIHIVNQDDVGGQKAAAYLTGLGHRDILVLAGPQTHRSHYLRLKGFRQFMEESGHSIESSSILTAETSMFEEGYNLMGQHWEYFRKAEYTAIFATNDMIALGAMKFLLEQSVSIPEQVAIMGFDDVDFAAMFSPSLTTIRVNMEEMGVQAFTMLDKLIRKETITANTIELEPKLIVRQSTEAK